MAAVVTAPHRHGGPGTALDKMASYTSPGLEAQYPSAHPAHRPEHVGHWMRRPSVTFRGGFPAFVNPQRRFGPGGDLRPCVCVAFVSVQSEGRCQPKFTEAPNKRLLKPSVVWVIWGNKDRALFTVFFLNKIYVA